MGLLRLAAGSSLGWFLPAPSCCGTDRRLPEQRLDRRTAQAEVTGQVSVAADTGIDFVPVDEVRVAAQDAGVDDAVSPHDDEPGPLAEAEVGAA